MPQLSTQRETVWEVKIVSIGVMVYVDLRLHLCRPTRVLLSMYGVAELTAPTTNPKPEWYNPKEKKDNENK